MIKNIPEKFQNEDGTLNADALLKSYAELERKIGAMITIPPDDADMESRAKFMRAIGVPESADAYDIGEMLDGEPGLKEKFLEIGLTRAQAAAVAKMAEDMLMPAIEDIADRQYEAEALSELVGFFGGEDAMSVAMKDIDAYASKHLPAEAIDSLCSTADGIKTIYSMMKSAEPVVQTSGAPSGHLTEADLRNLMKDPRYWRDHDAEFIRKIESGFKRLYS